MRDRVDLGVIDAGGGRRAAVEVDVRVGPRASVPDVVLVTVESFDDADAQPREGLLDDARELVEREFGLWLEGVRCTQTADGEIGRFHLIVAPAAKQPTHLLRWETLRGTVEQAELVQLDGEGAPSRVELAKTWTPRWSCRDGVWLLNGSAPRDCGLLSFRAVDLPLVPWRQVPITVLGATVSPDDESRLVLLTTWRADPVGSRESLGVDVSPSVSWVGFPVPPAAELNALGRLARGEAGLPWTVAVRARVRLRRALTALLSATRSSVEAAKVAGVSRAQFYLLLSACGLDVPSQHHPVL